MSWWLAKFVKQTDLLSSLSGMSVHDSRLLGKNNGDNTIMSGMSVLNPSAFRKNKDGLETTENVSNLLQRWKKKSAGMNLKSNSRKEDYATLMPKAECVGVKDNKAFVDVPTPSLQQTFIVNHEKVNLTPISENHLTDIPYQLITNVKEARDALNQLVARQEIVSLDLETTGLYPHEGAKARLLQVAPKDGLVLVIDLFQVGGLKTLKEPLQKLKAVAHNAVFEMKFLKVAGISVTLDCTLLANHILTGQMSKLSDLCFHYLGVSLDKTLQTSDWSGDLTDDQLKYAAADAYYTRLLFDSLCSWWNSGVQDVFIRFAKKLNRQLWIWNWLACLLMLEPIKYC